MVHNSGVIQAESDPILAIRPAALPLAEVLITPSATEEPAVYWYGGAGRALFAEEQGGCWSHIEYVFPLGSRLFELRWREGHPPRLWSMNRTLRDIELDTLVPNPRQRELMFPVEELQQIEWVMQDVPHSLWSKLIKLVLDAHFAEKPFPQRAMEPRIERRRVARE